MLYQKGKDVPVYVTYLNRRKNTFIVSEPIRYFEPKEKYGSFENIAEQMRLLLNSLIDK